LKEYERKILAADERILNRAGSFFVEVRSSVAAQAVRLRRTGLGCRADGRADLVAKLATDRGYSRPEFNSTAELLIIGGRHPGDRRIAGGKKGERFRSQRSFASSPGGSNCYSLPGRTWAANPRISDVRAVVLMAQMGSLFRAPGEAAHHRPHFYALGARTI